MRYDYTLEELQSTYQNIGINKGEALFVTTGLGFLGRMKGIKS